MQSTRQESLQEFVDARDTRMQVDRGQSVIRGVKILGLRSRNGRVYLPTALIAAAQLYEGAKVNVNHPKGHPHSPRDYQDRIGTLRGVAIREGEGLFGDLHLNPAHALAEQLLWDAQHAPGNVGLSHNVQAQTVTRGGATVVEAILKVQGVDLVADPATTRGLFEQANPGQSEASQHAVESNAGDGTQPEVNTVVNELREERDELHSEVERLRAQLTRQQRRDAARQLLVEAGLPDPDACSADEQRLVSEAFVESLLPSDGDAAMRALVLERAQLVQDARRWDPLLSREKTRDYASKPRSREQQSASQPAAIATVDEFVRAIT